MEKQTSPEIDQNIKKGKKIKPFYFFIGFLLISTVFAFILGGIFIGKENPKQGIRKENNSVDNQIKYDTLVLPDNPENWIVFKFEPLNIEFKLPEKLNKKSNWKINEIEGDKGVQICFSNEGLGNEDECIGKVLVISSTSKDFSTKRNLNFLDLQGFEIADEKYYLNTLDKKYEIENVRFNLFENNENFEIIKILGKNNLLDGTEADVIRNPGDGYLGAIVNTNYLDFPAVVLRMKIGSEISEYEFDQILESIKKIE